MTIKITPNDAHSPVGKLADAEIHFTEGPLAGLKLLGFGVWERRNGNGRNITFPARQYTVNGERRSYALLRPTERIESQDAIRDLILSAYARHMAEREEEQQQAEQEYARINGTAPQLPAAPHVAVADDLNF